MKMLSLLFLVVVAHATPSTKNITVNVRGMVCAFCAQGITKRFKGIPEIDAVKVDLDHKVVKLTLKDGKAVTDEKIKDAITESGFNVEKITREP